MRILGIEVTQSIQFFGSTFPVCRGLNGPIPCPDNSIPLVAGRPTAVRVYFDGAVQSARVTGFGVKQVGGANGASFPATQDVVNGTFPPARENAGSSVNIIIPPQESAGTWSLDVHIVEKLPNGLGQIASRMVELTFEERALVPVRLVRIHYTGDGHDDAPPTLREFWDVADFAQRVWPSPLPVFCLIRDSVELYDGAFTTKFDTSDPVVNGSTGTLYKILARLQAAEGLPSDVIYVALYPSNAGALGGVSWGSLMIAPNVVPTVLAHEFGHSHSLAHAPTPNVLTSPGSSPDLAFPHYGSLTWGSIGEVGFDPRTLVTHPGSEFDVLGYDNPMWLSPYNYQKIYATVGAPKSYACLGPKGLGPDIPIPFPGHKQQYFSCYYVEGLPGGIDKILCGPKVPLPFPWPIGPKGPGPWLRATMFDAAGGVLFENQFDIVSGSEPRDGQLVRTATVTLPEISGAARLVIADGDRIIEDSILETKPVPLNAKCWQPSGASGPLRVEWSVDARDDVPVFVRASTDRGTTWTGLNVPRGATALEIDPGTLPAGDGCIVQVLAGARLQTTAWTSEHFDVATGSEGLIPLRPKGDERRKYGELTELLAVATGGGSFEDIVWTSNKDGDLGIGGHQLVRLSPGHHRLRARLGPCGESIEAGNVFVEDAG